MFIATNMGVIPTTITSIINKGKTRAIQKNNIFGYDASSSSTNAWSAQRAHDTSWSLGVRCDNIERLVFQDEVGDRIRLPLPYHYLQLTGHCYRNAKPVSLPS